MDAVRTTALERRVVLPSENVDTDQIIPARFLKTTDQPRGSGHNRVRLTGATSRDGAPKPDFVLNRPSRSGRAAARCGTQLRLRLVARACGVGAARAAGFRAVVSSEFADIFRGNALGNGLLPVAGEPERSSSALRHWSQGSRVASSRRPREQDAHHSERRARRVPRRPVRAPLPAAGSRRARLSPRDRIPTITHLRARPREEHASMRASHRASPRRRHRSGDRRAGDARARRGGRALGSRSLREQPALIGGAAIDATGDPLPRRRRSRSVKRADAVLLGAVGGPKWDNPARQGAARAGAARHPEGARAVREPPARHACIRRCSRRVAAEGGAARGRRHARGARAHRRHLLRREDPANRSATAASARRDVCTYTTQEVERIVRMARQLARGRRGKLTSVDKANVLETSRLWRRVATRVIAGGVSRRAGRALARGLLRDAPRERPASVRCDRDGEHVRRHSHRRSGGARRLDRLAAVGIARRECGARRCATRHRGLYEPIHGSAPDIAGKGLANPVGTIPSVAMLLRHSLGLDEEARAVENAISSALDAGALTADLAPKGVSPRHTSEVGDAIVARIVSAVATVSA